MQYSLRMNWKHEPRMLHLKPDVVSNFHKPRLLPFAMKDVIGKGWAKKDGIVQKVSHRAWAAPIVAVPKKGGRFTICGDYRVTINYP